MPPALDTLAALTSLRGLLLPLVEELELDPARAPGAAGLVARIPVVGGRFLHPLTREPVQAMRVYGASGGRVKIVEPRFLRSLGLVPVAGLTHASQFCARVAKLLGEALGELGRLRDALRAMGLGLDLEPDVLRLAGRTELAGHEVALLAYRPAGLLVTGLAGGSLAGRVPPVGRFLALGGEPAADLAALTQLVQALAARVRDERPAPAALPVVAPEAVEPAPEVEYVPEVKPHLAAAVGALGGAAALDLSDAPAPAPAPAVPAVGLRDIPVPPPVSPVGPPPAIAEPAPLELTEEVTEEREDARPAPAPLPPPAAPAPAETQGALALEKLMDLFGHDAQVAAHGGKLRLTVPFRVVQGEFVFYLEQHGPRAFRGFLVSPQGARYPVELDLGAVFDLKEVFDRVMLGR